MDDLASLADELTAARKVVEAARHAHVPSDPGCGLCLAIAAYDDLTKDKT